MNGEPLSITWALGSKRAESVKDYLVTLGTPADRLSTISYGEELLVCRDQTEECWQKNRRVRFVIRAGNSDYLASSDCITLLLRYDNEEPQRSRTFPAPLRELA